MRIGSGDSVGEVGDVLGWVGPEEASSYVGSERGWPAGEDLAVGFVEGDGALPRRGDLPAAFVDHPVVAAAQHHQVVVIGRAAVGPVGEVVGVEPPGGPTALEATSSVSPSQLSEEPARDLAGGAPEADHFALVVLDD